MLFEIAFYRLSLEQRIEARNAYVEQGLELYRRQAMAAHGKEPSKDQLREKIRMLEWSGGFDTPYPYHEIFGWLRLFPEPPAVKGEAWRIDRKRPRRGSPAEYKHRGRALEVRLFEGDVEGDVDGFVEILRGRILALSEKGELFEGWHPDLDAFNTVAPLIDWHRLLRLSPGDRL